MFRSFQLIPVQLSNSRKRNHISSLLLLNICLVLSLFIPVDALGSADSQAVDDEVSEVSTDTAPIPLSFSSHKPSQRLTSEIFIELSRNHYNVLELDDQFSRKMLDYYFDRLDPTRVIFLKSDLAEFESHATLMDDHLKNGDLKVAQSIYILYQQRTTDLINHTLQHIDKYFLPYPYDDATVEIDRSEAERPESLADSIKLWDKRMYNEALMLLMADTEDADKTPKETLQKRYELRLSRMKDIENVDAFSSFINSALALYGPHTEWLSPRLEQNFKINMSLSLEGIGAVLQQEDEKTKVVRLVTGGPAAKSGAIHNGDFILAVGQGEKGDLEDMVGLRLDEVVEHIRGPKGSVVRLQIEDSDNQSLKVVTIEREKIKLEDQAAKSDSIKIGDKKIGIINVPAFYMDFEAYRRGDEDYRSTTRDVEKLLSGLIEDEIDGLVIDLRNNGGGSLREAKLLTNLFINRGPIVQIRSSHNQIDRSLRAEGEPLYMGPLLVITNHFSASASEIFAAAIQDYGRGLVFGEQTFGKGTVQTLNEMDYGQLKYTNAKFYRVSGDSTQHRGVIPDISIPSIIDFDDVGEAALDHALPWDQIHKISHIQYNQVEPYLSDLTNRHKQRMDSNPDYLFLNQKIERRREKDNIRFLSLDKNIREKENEDDNQWVLSGTNAMRKAKSLPPFDSYQALEDHQEDLAAEWNGTTVIDLEDDFILKEAANILGDFIHLKIQTEGTSFAVQESETSDLDINSVSTPLH